MKIMIMDLLLKAASIFVGFAGGIAVGSALVALLTVLDFLSRLAQFAKTRKYGWMEVALISGAVSWSIIDFQHWHLHLPHWMSSFWGLLGGIFVGLLAAALTEVLNVLPILAKRIKMNNLIQYFLLAMILGKVMGSLFHWLIFTRL